MGIPDHYNILQISPQASPLEIKKAYRRLAQQFHPDKTQNDPWAAARFAAIKEAYETLSTPWKKQQYLEARWHAKSKGEQPETMVRTPAAILQEALRIERETASADIFRLDKNQLLHEMKQVLDTPNMECLLRFNEASINQQIVHLLCRPLRLLSPAAADQLKERLQQLAGDDAKTNQHISTVLQMIRRDLIWQRLQWILIPLSVGLLYLLIRFTRSS